MQKLVTVYVDNSGYKRGKLLVGSYGDLHGRVEEHLGQYTADGWTVKSVAGLDGSGETLNVRGQFAVVLEKPDR